MGVYEVGFVFFIESGNKDSVEKKDNLLSAIDDIGEIASYDVFDDGEDYNIECTAIIEREINGNRVDDVIHKVLMEILPNVTWDYHYIKGINNSFYWAP
jgi:hypothetical protein